VNRHMTGDTRARADGHKTLSGRSSNQLRVNMCDSESIASYRCSRCCGKKTQGCDSSSTVAGFAVRCMVQKRQLTTPIQHRGSRHKRRQPEAEKAERLNYQADNVLDNEINRWFSINTEDILTPRTFLLHSTAAMNVPLLCSK